MLRSGTQGTLFSLPQTYPNGLVYRPDFLTPEEEDELIYCIEAQPLTHSRLGEYVAQRRLIGFGWGYDFERKVLTPGPPLPHFLRSLQKKIAKWLDIPAARVAEALVQEYTAGAPIGWHRDNESFESIIGISLAGWCKMRFRPLPSIQKPDAKNILSLDLEPRSAYIMQDDIRWRWQHSIPAVRNLRYSITFRTLPKDVRL